jgi:plastocyanin
MRRFAAFLTLVALAFIAAACGGDGEPPAQAAIEVEITADGFNPASAEVTVGQEINFNNNDSKPHKIMVPAGHEQVVEAGETFNFKAEGCCAATFTDKETGDEFEVTVGDS